MTQWLDQYEQTRDRLEAGHAYDRSSERDACGVGLVCSIDGTPRRDVVEYAIRSLKAVAHRGAVDPDGLSGLRLQDRSGEENPNPSITDLRLYSPTE